MRILITEDDRLSRRVLELFMQPYGQCTTAADGTEALTKFHNAVEKKQPFDLIFMDVVMPGMEGIEVLRSIREWEKKHGIALEQGVKVVMLTGKADVSKINDASALGISVYLLKPIEEQKLLRELQRLELIEDPQDTWDNNK